MSQNVRVPYGDSAKDTATLLLAAAEETGDGYTVVRTQSDGAFLVPEEVAKKAGVEYDAPEGDEPEPEPTPAPAKKTTARKTAEKKTEESA